jgi:hypothetical protein
MDGHAPPLPIQPYTVWVLGSKRVIRSSDLERRCGIWGSTPGPRHGMARRARGKVRGAEPPPGSRASAARWRGIG